MENLDRVDHPTAFKEIQDIFDRQRGAKTRGMRLDTERDPPVLGAEELCPECDGTRLNIGGGFRGFDMREVGRFRWNWEAVIPWCFGKWSAPSFGRECYVTGGREGKSVK